MAVSSAATSSAYWQGIGPAPSAELGLRERVRVGLGRRRRWQSSDGTHREKSRIQNSQDAAGPSDVVLSSEKEALGVRISACFSRTGRIRISFACPAEFQRCTLESAPFGRIFRLLRCVAESRLQRCLSFCPKHTFRIRNAREQLAVAEAEFGAELLLGF